VTKEKIGDGADCPDLKATQPCPSNCSECVEPREKGCIDPCDTKCEHVRQTVECMNPTGKCIEDCRCPPGLYENEDNECVPKEECGCEWDSKIFGDKPAGDPKYYPDGYVLKKGICNNCTCKGYQWSCTYEECTRDCVWGDWQKVENCNGTCGTGTQLWKREISVTKKGDGNECEGNDTKTTDCELEDCVCDDNEEYSETDLCEPTCDNHLNSEPQTRREECKKKCKCINGFVRKDDKCVLKKECEKCVIDNVTYDAGSKIPATPEEADKCIECRCYWGQKECDDYCNDNRTCAEGLMRVKKEGTKCCYECKPPPVCKPTTKTVKVVDFIAKENKDLMDRLDCVMDRNKEMSVTTCEGTCQYASSTSKLRMVYEGQTMLAGGIGQQDCKCCKAFLHNTPQSFSINCVRQNGESRIITMYNFAIKSCECTTCDAGYLM